MGVGFHALSNGYNRPSLPGLELEGQVSPVKGKRGLSAVKPPV